MSECRVGNNSSSSYSGYSGGYSSSGYSSSPTLPELIRAALGGSLEGTIFYHASAEHFRGLFRVFAGISDVSHLPVLLPEPLQQFFGITKRWPRLGNGHDVFTERLFQPLINNPGYSALSAMSFSSLAQNEQECLLRELLNAIERHEVEETVRQQKAAEAQAAARAEQQRREQKEALRQKRAADAAAHEELLARQRRLKQAMSKFLLITTTIALVSITSLVVMWVFG